MSFYYPYAYIYKKNQDVILFIWISLYGGHRYPAVQKQLTTDDIKWNL